MRAVSRKGNQVRLLPAEKQAHLYGINCTVISSHWTEARLFWNLRSLSTNWANWAWAILLPCALCPFAPNDLLDHTGSWSYATSNCLPQHPCQDAQGVVVHCKRDSCRKKQQETTLESCLEFQPPEGTGNAYKEESNKCNRSFALRNQILCSGVILKWHPQDEDKPYEATAENTMIVSWVLTGK